jgi:hypothetical protein
VGRNDRSRESGCDAASDFLAHGYVLIDEQYFFESADDAWWFWNEGYKERLYVDDEGASMSYDRMARWIDGEEIDSRG